MTDAQMKSLAIVEAVHKVMRENPEMPVMDALEVAYSSPAPSFFISYGLAVKYVAAYDKGRGIKTARPELRENIKELHRRYKKRVKNGCKGWRYSVLREIVEEPAPSFYIAKESFINNFYATLRAKKYGKQ